MEYKFLIGVLIACVFGSLNGAIFGIIYFGYIKPRLDKKKNKKDKKDKNL